MKKGVFIASSAELKRERLELVDLLLDLNIELKAKDVKWKPELWEFMDSSMQEGRKEDEYLEKLKKCEVCVAIFWKALGQYTVEELDVAVAEVKAGRLPKQVYVWFKEPSDGISPELSDFKANFSKNYPCIPCRVFTEADTLRKEVAGVLVDLS